MNGGLANSFVEMGTTKHTLRHAWELLGESIQFSANLLYGAGSTRKLSNVFALPTSISAEYRPARVLVFPVECVLVN